MEGARRHRYIEGHGQRASSQKLGVVFGGLTVTLVAMQVILWLILNAHELPPHYSDPANVSDFLFFIATMVVAMVGTIIALRQPRHPIGWLLFAIGASIGLSLVSYSYAAVGVFVEPAVPGTTFAAWLVNWAWALPLPTVTIFLLLFPTGRYLSRRWRWIGLVAGLSGGILIASTMFDPSPYEPGNFEMIENSFGIQAAAPLLDAMFLAGYTGTGVTLLIAAAGVLIRFRRSSGIERQQLKWLVYATALTALSFVLSNAGIIPEDVSDASFALGLTGIATAVGFAMLRYRLYDIDRLINRTLVYGLLTATLLATYFALVLGLETLVQVGTGESSPVIVATSTLAVAALFRPVRGRIQALVDRRFYRQKYDAARTLEQFSARLRDEVDMDALADDLQSVVRDTMQPAHVSLWLKTAGTEMGRT